ncbi:hypothetical protein [Pleurocapsa sp. FMAR1]|uniref:hypothetical protein n=1 Tax=Pleurocapsa sp. FMAR1 TaxID=3040204 RepID=UPI0029C892B3|nr:hypothetical protein [Pleurocapsa sp. FMAR1]
MKKSRLIITETDESIEIIIPPPRFHSHMTIVCIVCDLILLFPLLLIAYGFYYAELVYKIALLIFSIPWLGFGVIINIILIALFIDKTLISVNSEKINISHTFKKESTKPLSFQTEDIVSLRISKSNNKPDNMYPRLYIVTKEEENDISCIFTNEENIVLANKINKYIHKDIIE